MSAFLDRMRRASEARVSEARSREPLSASRARVRSMPPAPRLAPHPTGFDVIAEVKLSAPSAGVLARPADAATFAADRAKTFARAGAAVISVLTEPSEFGGDLSHLAAAAAASCDFGVPVLRKDFIVDPLQVFEARAHGAGGILLIARLADAARLRELHDAAREAGLFALLEAFDEQDVDVARALAASTRDPSLLVGVNVRDLATLGVDRDRLCRLAPLLPRDTPAVAESGIESPSDCARAAALGYRFALIGTALMRAEDPAHAVMEFTSAGRAAREASCASS